MNKNDLIGNITTIVNTLVVVFAGYITGVLASKGLNIPEETVTELLSTLIFTLFAYYNAKYSNSFFNNNKVSDSKKDDD